MIQKYSFHFLYLTLITSCLADISISSHHQKLNLDKAQFVFSKEKRPITKELGCILANITAVVPVDSSCTTSGGFRPSSLGRGPRCSSRHSSSPSWTTLVPLDPSQPSPECWTTKAKFPAFPSLDLIQDSGVRLQGNNGNFFLSPSHSQPYISAQQLCSSELLLPCPVLSCK